MTYTKCNPPTWQVPQGGACRYSIKEGLFL